MFQYVTGLKTGAGFQRAARLAESTGRACSVNNSLQILKTSYESSRFQQFEPIDTLLPLSCDHPLSIRKTSSNVRPLLRGEVFFWMGLFYVFAVMANRLKVENPGQAPALTTSVRQWFVIP